MTYQGKALKKKDGDGFLAIVLLIISAVLFGCLIGEGFRRQCDVWDLEDAAHRRDVEVTHE